ncbi:MAG: zinc-dependent peptidase, partial [Bacteroidia bacterium]|nr:zinc-dependent peptidase [Bacteroidia bacterium]
DTINDYNEIISGHLPYFNGLTEEEKLRFIKRVYRFHHAKHFHFVGLAEQKEGPVLISAVAIQISFGLRKYMLSYFKDIYITADAYHLHGASELYVGHVSPKGIYISWKHFLEGFADQSDGFNVAYHELAHAVHRENFMDEGGEDWEFREDFAKLSHVYGPLTSLRLSLRGKATCGVMLFRTLMSFGQ